mmetsp:Transcript_6582/g.17071  ORF Transcript_6582/g.17071 Transcript_6582/m.17071 type:complete len:88 (-) Transcript_6582:761-1024(-)
MVYGPREFLHTLSRLSLRHSCHGSVPQVDGEERVVMPRSFAQFGKRHAVDRARSLPGKVALLLRRERLPEEHVATHLGPESIDRMPP